MFTEPGSGWANMTQTAKLTASDGAAGDYFGSSVSISGNTVVVGANGATVGANSSQGAAYVFTESGSGWANMTQTAKLTASDGAVDDAFGFSVSISGNTMVVGAVDAKIGANTGQGAAYVFGSPAVTTTAVTTSRASVTYGTPVTFTATVSAQSGSTPPIAGSVDFFDTTTGADLGLGTFGSSTGTTSTWTSDDRREDLQRHHRGHHHRQLCARCGFHWQQRHDDPDGHAAAPSATAATTTAATTA